MPRGTQFDQLITMFREEAGQAVSRRQGQNTLPGVQAMLRRTYRRLHVDFDWPHLRVVREKTLQAGEQFYAFPPDLAYDRMEDTWVRENGRDIWYPLNYGIDIHHLNTVHSHQGEREDFPHAWELAEGETFEVWPIPVNNGDVVRFTGFTRPKPLTNGSDSVDLDDDLIVLYAVAEHLARQKSADAEMKLQQARQHYLRLRGNSQLDEPFSMQVSQDRHASHQPIDIRFAERRG